MQFAALVKNKTLPCHPLGIPKAAVERLHLDCSEDTTAVTRMVFKSIILQYRLKLLDHLTEHSLWYTMLPHVKKC